MERLQFGALLLSLAACSSGTKMHADPSTPDDGGADTSVVTDIAPPDTFSASSAEAGPEAAPDSEPDAVDECVRGDTQPCYEGPEGTEGVGVCHAGEQVCELVGEHAAWETTCEGAVTPRSEELCDNGLDDNCDNQIDEGCGCVDGDDCYSGPPGTSEEGLCHKGGKVCSDDGSWRCEEEVVPRDEICGNEIDEDCDGMVDDGCGCTPGVIDTCYDGPLSTLGVAACHGGTHTCTEEGVWGPCEGQVIPQFEECDGVDDNCDGLPDNGCCVEALCLGVPTQSFCTGDVIELRCGRGETCTCENGQRCDFICEDGGCRAVAKPRTCWQLTCPGCDCETEVLEGPSHGTQCQYTVPGSPL